MDRADMAALYYDGPQRTLDLLVKSLAAFSPMQKQTAVSVKKCECATK